MFKDMNFIFLWQIYSELQARRKPKSLLRLPGAVLLRNDTRMYLAM